jgi:hypothetical protein
MFEDKSMNSDTMIYRSEWFSEDKALIETWGHECMQFTEEHDVEIMFIGECRVIQVVSKSANSPEIVRVVDDMIALMNRASEVIPDHITYVQEAFDTLVGSGHVLAGFGLLAAFAPGFFFDRLMAMNLAPSIVFAMAVPCHMHSLCARSIASVFAECVCRTNVGQIVEDLGNCERFFHCALQYERYRPSRDASQTWVISSLQNLGKRCIAFASIDELSNVLEFFINVAEGPVAFAPITEIILGFPFVVTEENEATRARTLLNVLLEDSCPFAIELIILGWAAVCFREARSLAGLKAMWNVETARELMQFTQQRLDGDDCSVLWDCLTTFMNATGDDEMTFSKSHVSSDDDEEDANSLDDFA